MEPGSSSSRIDDHPSTCCSAGTGGRSLHSWFLCAFWWLTPGDKAQLGSLTPRHRALMELQGLLALDLSDDRQCFSTSYTQRFRGEIADAGRVNCAFMLQESLKCRQQLVTL